MKICVIGLRGLPGVMGGVETHCEQLYPRLKVIRPSDEFVVVGRKAYIERSEFAYKGLRVVPLFAVRNKYLEAISNALIGVIHARFKVGADIVHIHAIGPALVAPLAKMLGMKVVVTHHGDDYNRLKWNRFAKAMLRVGEYLGVRFCDQMIPISASVTRRLKSRFPDIGRRFRHIPNGANHVNGGSATRLSTHRPDIIERHGLAGLRYVTCVGRLVPEKCFEDIIAAFERVPDLDRLVIVGGADESSSYWQKLRRIAGNRVVFAGAVPRQDVDTLLSHAALFVLPSSHEGLPIVALEAIAAGIPVLLSDIEPNLDIGLPPNNYFRLHDIDELASKMRSDIDSYRVRKELCEQYDWNAISYQTNAVYEQLIPVDTKVSDLVSHNSRDRELR